MPDPFSPGQDPRPQVRELLESIKRRMEEIDRLASGLSDTEEDGVYRYYHQSLEGYTLQRGVIVVSEFLQSLAPAGIELNPWFVAICDEACAHKFDFKTSNQNWHAETRPILEALWHCSYFVRMLARFGRELEQPPSSLPSGWAAVLYLYGLR